MPACQIYCPLCTIPSSLNPLFAARSSPPVAALFRLAFIGQWAPAVASHSLRSGVDNEQGTVVPSTSRALNRASHVSPQLQPLGFSGASVLPTALRSCPRTFVASTMDSMWGIDDLELERMFFAAESFDSETLKFNRDVFPLDGGSPTFGLPARAHHQPVSSNSLSTSKRKKTAAAGFGRSTSVLNLDSPRVQGQGDDDDDDDDRRRRRRRERRTSVSTDHIPTNSAQANQASSEHKNSPPIQSSEANFEGKRRAREPHSGPMRGSVGGYPLPAFPPTAFPAYSLQQMQQFQYQQQLQLAQQQAKLAMPRKEKCRDYEVQGVCLKGYLCPFDHGTDFIETPFPGQPGVPPRPQMPMPSFPGAGLVPPLPPHIPMPPRAAGGYNPENPALGPRPPFPMPPFPGVPSNPSRGDFNGKKPCFQFRSGQCTSGDSKYSRISLELDWFHLCPLRFPCLHEEMCCQSKHTSSQSLRWCYARTLLTLTPQVPLCHSLSCILLCALSLIVRSFLPANHENPFYRFVSFVFDYECCLFFFFFFSLFC
eukprot:m.180114 g.180114  ORF g.180114 m.180114 type:complete len:538 (-) comp53441_c0_seq7:151-1764(-)